MPQLSHRILPSSRWNQSTVRLPFTASSARTRSSTSLSTAANAGSLGGDGRVAEQAGEVVGDRVRQHEVAVGEALHERAGAEAVGAVVGEVRLAQHVEARDVAHQVVVDPQAAHRVVDGRIDAHGHDVRVLARDALVHLEQVAVALLDDVAAEPADRVREVEVHAVLQRADAPAGVDLALRRPRRDVAGHEVAEGGIPALEEVVALGLRDLVGGAGVVRSASAPRCGRRCAATRS